MFYGIKPEQTFDDDDDWETDTDAINTENIRTGASAAEKLGPDLLNAAEAARRVKEQALAQPTYRPEGRAEENTRPNVSTPTSYTPPKVTAPTPVQSAPKVTAPASRGVAAPAPRGGAAPRGVTAPRGAVAPRGASPRGAPRGAAPPRGGAAPRGAPVPAAAPIKVEPPKPAPVKVEPPKPAPVPVKVEPPKPAPAPAPAPVKVEPPKPAPVEEKPASRAPKKPPPPPPQSSKPKRVVEPPPEPEPEPEGDSYYDTSVNYDDYDDYESAYGEAYAGELGGGVYGEYQGDPDEYNEGPVDANYDYGNDGYEQESDNWASGTTSNLIATALYDFDGQQEGDLSFNVGDQIAVIDQSDPSGWWEGELNGQRGVFPSNFVQLN